MACLIDLSRELQIRVEALQRELSDSGLGEFALDEECLEVAEFLIHQFTTEQENQGWSSRLRGFLGRLWMRRRNTQEDEEYLSEDSPPAAPVDQMAMLPPAMAPEEEPLEEPLTEGVTEAGLELTELLESIEESHPGQEESPAQEELVESLPAASTGISPVEAEQPAGPLVFGPLEEEIPEEAKLELPPDLLMASLEQIEQIQEDLGSGPVEIFEELLPDLNQEPGLAEPLLTLEEEELEEEEGQGQEQDLFSEFALEPPAEELSSVRLQALVDNLAEGMPDLNTVPVVQRIPLLTRLREHIPSIHLDLKQKMALVAAGMVVVAA